jgi:hypothetical protein
MDSRDINPGYLCKNLDVTLILGIFRDINPGYLCKNLDGDPLLSMTV